MIDQLEQSGLRVPQDVSVIGHDDIPIAAHSRIQLTTIRSDAVQMGRRAVDLLVGAAREGRRVGRTRVAGKSADHPLDDGEGQAMSSVRYEAWKSASSRLSR